MKRFDMYIYAAALLFVLNITACEYHKPGGKDDEPNGRIVLSLTARGASGDTYVLRNATFTIVQQYSDYPEYYQPDVELNTEDDPASTYLSATVIPGSYYVTLSDGWYIEKLTDGGVGMEVEALLLSPVSQYTYVWEDGTRTVVYRFGIGSDILEFVSGDIRIRIEIEEADGGSQGPDAGPSIDAGGYWD